MKEISNHFCLINPEPGKIYTQTLGSVPEDAVEIICSRKILFDQAPVNDADGRRWSVNISAATANPEVMEFDGSHQYVGLILTDGSVRVIGAPGFAPQISVTPHENAFAIAVKCDTLAPYNL